MTRNARRFYAAGSRQVGRGLAGAFRDAVDWIAENDEPGDVDPTSVDGYVSTLLVADVFKIPAAEVAEIVVRYRKLRDGLVSDAAKAVEIFGEDELERFAERGRRAQAAVDALTKKGGR